MSFLSSNIAILPVLIPLLGAIVALALRRWPRLQGGWALGTMTISLVISLALLWQVWQTGPVVFQAGGWVAPFGISFVADLLSMLFVVMTQLVMVSGLLYALGSKDKVIGYSTFYTLFLTLATGLTGTFLTGDLFNMFVFAELLVISGTVLTAAADDRYGTEAAYKYFYISLLASAFMLLSIGSLYAAYGTLNMADLGARIAADPSRPLLMPGVALLFATFMIKSAVFPFHFWQPDFHAAAPTAVSAMLSSVVVKLGIYGFLRMNTLLFVEQAPTLQMLLLVLGVAGVVFGGLSALGTHNVKRMLAYSTLAQVGFILIGIGWGSPASIAAALVFAFNHSLIKAAMLMLAGYVASRASIKSASFEVVTGVGKNLPLAGVLFFMGSLALSGIPPTSGFISKALLFRSGIGVEGYVTLAIIGLASILTLMYTIRAFQRIWWLPLAEGGKVKAKGDALWAPALLIVLVLVTGIWANPLIALAQETAVWLGDATQYIQAVALAMGG
jgi:multicomponent Na+:H+ antiporter subunit D